MSISVIDKISLIEQERAKIEATIDDIENTFNHLKRSQKKVHEKVKKATVKDFEVNLSCYFENKEIYEITDSLIDKIQKLHLEKLVWINLSIYYAKKANPGYTTDIKTVAFNTKKRKAIILDMLEEMEQNEMYEYCSVLAKEAGKKIAEKKAA